MDAWFFENWPWRACRGKWFCQCCSYHFKRILSWHLYEGADGLLEATLCYMAVNMSIFRMCCLSQMNKSHLTVSWFNIHFHPKKNIKQDVMTWILTRIHYKEHCQRKVSRRLPVPSGQQNKKNIHDIKADSPARCEHRYDACHIRHLSTVTWWECRSACFKPSHRNQEHCCISW